MCNFRKRRKETGAHFRPIGEEGRNNWGRGGRGKGGGGSLMIPPKEEKKKRRLRPFHMNPPQGGKKERGDGALPPTEEGKEGSLQACFPSGMEKRSEEGKKKKGKKKLIQPEEGGKGRKKKGGLFHANFEKGEVRKGNEREIFLL